MKSNIKIAASFLMILLVTSCQNFNELVKNPNLPESSPPSYILTGLLNSLNTDNAWSGAMGFNQFWISTYTYYGTNNYDQAPFTNSSFSFVNNPSSQVSLLESVIRLEEESKKAGSAVVNPYSAFAKFFKAYYYYLMSQKFGELPLTNGLQGVQNPTPAYDNQKTVFAQILKWLDDANSEFGQLIANRDPNLAGDIYFNNDLSKWQKVVNSYTLRVLISLSKKDADAELNIKQKFAAILSDGAKYPLMGGLADNLQYVYNTQFTNYPKTPNTIGQVITRENVSATLLNLTTSFNDPRTFIFATPAPNQLIAPNNKPVTDFAAYVGANPGSDMGTLGINSQSGNYSFVNSLRYYSTLDGSKAEPAIIIGYPEMCFNIAEGINRGWATGNSTTWYTNGIKASMAHFGITEGGSVTISGKDLNSLGAFSASITAYLNQASVIYKGDNSAGLTQILQQKYIAFWQNSNWEAFFNQRRTGVPTFLTGSGTGNGGKIPMRWMYPIAERSANANNYTASINNQFGGTDDLNGLIWIVK
ncbi:MAG: SusD/RagB family nutrient-binding outer membrane lipoprotein [Bacteroidetes bacterium]|nr:SusD/RagB family nutrient-binding outer membrane lipoprotein [Bacteroidota bacterium]